MKLKKVPVTSNNRTWLVLFVCVLFLSCKHRIREIEYGNYVLKGNIQVIGKDTIFDGPIEYFNSHGRIVSRINYSDNKKNGKEISFYANGIPSQESNFYYDYENGISKLYDSMGRLVQQKTYYHGIPVGSIEEFRMDTFYSYRFENFEGIPLYRCQYDTFGKIVESGNILNYVTNYGIIDGVEKVTVFLYLVDPPHKKISYKLFDVNLQNKDTILMKTVKSSTTSAPFAIIYLNIPPKNHKYHFEVEAFYPKENVLLKNILTAKESDFIMPGM
jgi:antitoxin component YwqK of YwqJK toxin-antitoxin module